MKTMADRIKKMDAFLVQRLWGSEAGAENRIRRQRTRFLRILYLALRSLGEEQLILRAMSLVYTTLLSLVPLLAVSFSVLKAFGVHAKFLIVIYYFLEPLGESGIDLSMKIIGFVENVKVSVLGSIGLSALIYTVISTIQKAESALNYIWHINGTRSFSQRFSNYMSVLLVGPVLIFSAFGITAAIIGSELMKKVMAVHALGFVMFGLSRLAPYLLITAAFTMIYIFLPNTKVRFRAALSGGIAAAVLWQTIGWMFASFIASSAQYSAIYSGFATLILLLIWLYWNFLTLLIGARISFFVQHPGLLDSGGRVITMSEQLRERLAVAVMFLVGSSFHSGERQWDFAALTARLGMPSEYVLEVVSLLEEKGLLVRAGAEPFSYMPAKDLEVIFLSEIVAAVRSSEDGMVSSARKAVAVPEADAVMKLIDEAIDSSLKQRTLRDLIATGS